MEDLACAEGRFIYTEATDGQGANAPFEASSGAKWAYRGRYVPYRTDDGVPAIAVFSCRNNETCLKREMAALGQGEHRGFGPALFANAESPRPGDASATKLSVAIEEDAGIALSRLLAGEPAPGDRPQALLPPGTAEGDRQSAKILFDVTCQLANMHRCGLYHHDVKASNICVRSIGEEPADLRATLIDFDHAMHEADGMYVQSTPAYYDLLFRDLPAAAGGGPYEPSSLQRDLGCLAVVWCEVAHRKELRYSRLKGAYSLSADDLDLVFGAKNPFFWYEGSVPHARKLDFYSDLMPLAKRAGLVEADRLALPFDVQRRASLFRCGSYFDKECLERLERAHEENLGSMEGAIARAIFDNYNAHLQEDGEQVKYPDFDGQPAESRYSNYAQAASFVANVWRLGLEIVSAERADAGTLLESFSDDQVGLLARWEHERWMDERLELGWTFGRTPDGRSDFANRVSPSLVPYDELDPKMRAYDERPMREMISILRSRGLAIRPR